MTRSPARHRGPAALLGVLALLLPAGCSTSPPQADYPAYTSSAELIDKADLIVRGVALKSRPGKLRPDPPTGTDPQANPQAGLPTAEAEAAGDDAVDVTITTVRVDEVFKGAAGNQIEVSRLAGENALAAKSDYLLFLASFGPGQPHSLLNPDALYAVADGGALTPAGSGTPPLATLDELRSAVHP
jgi:hypothetical protein